MWRKHTLSVCSAEIEKGGKKDYISLQMHGSGALLAVVLGVHTT